MSISKRKRRRAPKSSAYQIMKLRINSLKNRMHWIKKKLNIQRLKKGSMT
jgi:hypothetical protein